MLGGKRTGTKKRRLNVLYTWNEQFARTNTQRSLPPITITLSDTLEDDTSPAGLNFEDEFKAIMENNLEVKLDLRRGPDASYDEYLYRSPQCVATFPGVTRVVPKKEASQPIYKPKTINPSMYPMHNKTEGT